MNPLFLKKSKFQTSLNENYSQCLICERKCKIMKEKSGFCHTRVNLDGCIHSIVYGLIPSLSYNFIEKKPLYHFHPGSIAITLGTYGCNFSCFWCQNHHISQPSKQIIDLVKRSTEYIPPKKIIELAKINKCQGTSISFNEPTLLFEYSLDLFKLAKNEGLYNTYVTNGYMTEDVLRELAKSGLNAMNIDIKGDSKMVKRYCKADIENVWNTATLAKNLGIHIELTTLLIEGLNSNDEIIKSISKRIIDDLGIKTPFHISRFFPHYRSHEYDITKPTPIGSLYKAYNAAKKIGLEFVYLGNLAHSNYENTYCPKCSSLVIERPIYGVTKTKLKLDGTCVHCGYPIITKS
ncbi:MAG: AmmeMemoRadiSam system radical SAM enzyme [Candidatus Lokiarchaeota archaeon]|nr:AmmeMemoRadiSam system radical SAM enzyme [Candidatus Lokiarchaeota archaeon]